MGGSMDRSIRIKWQEYVQQVVPVIRGYGPDPVQAAGRPFNSIRVYPVYSIRQDVNLILIVVTLIEKINGFSSGAPLKTCIDLTPKHSGGQIQTSYPPYQVLPAAGQGRVRLILGSPQGLAYQGFFILARDVESGELIGEFSNLPDNAKFVECTTGVNNAVTHTSKEKKHNLEFDWIAPPQYEGTIIFNSTFAQDYATYWVGVESPKVTVLKRSIDVLTSSTSSTTLRTTTPPYYNPRDDEKDDNEDDPFYEGCSETKNCFGLPDGCLQTKNCKIAVSVLVRGDRYLFEMQGREGKYVAVGLSENNKMDDDSVVECTNDGNDIKLYTSWNTPNKRNERHRLQQGSVQLESASSIGDQINCKFWRDKITVAQGHKFDLVNKPYYLLLAQGAELGANGIGYHDLLRDSTGEAKLLSDVGSFTVSNNMLIHIHGSLMIVAWMGTTSVAILLARYYKQTWVHSRMCGKDHWFAWHTLLNSITCILTLIAIVVIFVELGTWSTETFHASLGLATTILCFIQPFIAAMRPEPNAPRRQLFNWTHWFIGNAAQICAIVALFFAVRLSKAKLPDWVDWILVAYVIFHVLTHVILTFLGYAPDRESSQRGDSFPMKDMSPRGQMTSSDTRMEAPRAGLRKLILGIYVLIIIVFLAILITIVVLAPIEETWSSIKNTISSY
ncbi:PREDICTED: putative ferric-chelate reductase 1 homolog [Polistes canadensis]|uniref:putative ferric-chelate reductase 1 homolog n=1 Tax=Polistes canadensis TaxID=91411 RepID=UPI000718C4B4|nr:PREDICTED: putative ferric-chelate reductase 1 homolog [Polistes canadensis]